MPQKPQKIRHLRKGRCTAVLVLILMIITLVYGGISQAAADGERPMVQVTVGQGDTLWSLTQKHYDYSGDIRQAIYEIKQLNGLTDAVIIPGQVLLIPQQQQ